MLMQSFIERLRPLVGIKSWDYIVLWKLSNDHRCIEWMDCCCAGSENFENGGEELSFEASSSSSSSSSSTPLPCRDVMFPHPRIAPCDLLDQLPSSMLLVDSGIHAQTLLSNLPSWLNYSQNSDSCVSQEIIGTRVFIPLSLGLLELFVSKQFPEDQQVIDFIRAQCNIFLEHQTMSNSGTTGSFSSDPNAPKDPLTIFQQQIPPEPSKENLDLPHDISIDRIHLCTSPLNTLQQFSNASETGHTNSGIFLEGTAYDSHLFTPSIENEFQEVQSIQANMMSNSSRATIWMEPSGTVENKMNDNSFICENNRSDDSDPNDDEDDAKYRRRTGKGPQSKNLMAERKRRKKLNDRLYSLRALVPKISKLDRASILGDAIDYVMELQKQVEDLTIELEEHSDEEDASKAGDGIEMRQNGMQRDPKRENKNFLNGLNHKGSSGNNNNVNISKQNHEQGSTNEKLQQMEPQVEVFQLNGNEFFVKVFCEHKSGGFVGLMEALNSLGLEVTTVNATRHTCLVSSIFKVEVDKNQIWHPQYAQNAFLLYIVHDQSKRKNDGTVQADHVKESLLELTRNPSRMWPNVAEESENCSNIDKDCHIHHDYGHHSILQSRQMNSHHLQRLHH